MLKVSVITAPSLVVIGSSVFFGGYLANYKNLLPRNNGNAVSVKYSLKLSKSFADRLTAWCRFFGYILEIPDPLMPLQLMFRYGSFAVSLCVRALNYANRVECKKLLFLDLGSTA